MPRKSQAFDFRKPVAYDREAKRAFHTQARRQLRLLGAALGLSRDAYELRTVRGNVSHAWETLPPVSGEVTLHGDRIYVQVSQPPAGLDGILFRSCEGRDDRDGGANKFASLDLLNQPEVLALLIKEKCGI